MCAGDEIRRGPIARVHVHVVPRHEKFLSLAQADGTVPDASVPHARLDRELLVHVKVHVRNREAHPRPHHAPDLQFPAPRSQARP